MQPANNISSSKPTFLDLQIDRALSQDDPIRSRMLEQLVPTLVQRNNITRAHDLAMLILNPIKQTQILESICYKLSQSGKISRAISISDSIPIQERRDTIQSILYDMAEVFEL